MIAYSTVVSNRERKKVELFLEQFSLSLERDVEYTIVATDGEDIVATGSLSKNVLKCFAIDERYQGQNITGTIVTKLMEREAERGIFHLFIFTKPKNKTVFSSIGFEEVATAEYVTLLDNQKSQLLTLVTHLEKQKRSGKISSLVMNCNPFTKGHLQLVEKAANESDYVHLFLVREDASVFPYDGRYQMVKEGVAHLPNVLVHEGNEYMISKNTFPTYFYKDEKIVLKSYSELDLIIFCRYFAKALGITHRYVGTEPIDIVTGTYNEAMREILPQYGIEVVEVNRFEQEGRFISATKVRELIKNGKTEEAYSLLPDSTISYLQSPQGQEVIRRLQDES